MTRLTKEQVQAELKQLAEDHPDNETECMYVRFSKPFCIAACFLANHGVSVEKLREFDTINTNTVDNLYATHVEDLPPLTADAVKFLRDVQWYQDRGYSWHYSYEKALEDKREDER